MVDEEHSDGEFVAVEHAVLIDVREVPDASQDRVRQFRSHHLFSGSRTCVCRGVMVIEWNIRQYSTA